MIITIARQNGSGGREIARILSERLGIECYDTALITETARKAGMTVDEVYESEEREGKGRLTFYGIPPANPLHRYQFEAIRELAGKGRSCVFVGRCADHVLEGRGDLIRVFVHASQERCVERSAARNGITGKQAAARVSEKNLERAQYYQRYTGKVWGLAQYYDLCIDTTSITLEQAADLIVEYASMKGILPERE